MFAKLRAKALALQAGVLALFVAPSVSFAQAVAVDVSDVVAEIALAATPIAAIGGAVLAVLVGIKVFKWVRRAM